MVCSKCGTQLAEGAGFCPNCGTPTAGGPQPQAQAYYADPADHTREFDAKDIADNKVYAMLPYLMGLIGVIVAAIVAKDSAYVKFHNLQGAKLSVATTLVTLLTGVLSWTCIVPFVGGIVLVVLAVISIICFFQVCKGQAKEPAIIKDLKIFK